MIALVGPTYILFSLCCNMNNSYIYTLSGRIGKVVASHVAVARSSPAEDALIYTMHVALRGYCP